MLAHFKLGLQIQGLPFHHNGNPSFIIFEPLTACAEVNYCRSNDFADFNEQLFSLANG